MAAYGEVFFESESNLLYTMVLGYFERLHQSLIDEINKARTITST